MVRLSFTVVDKRLLFCFHHAYNENVQATCNNRKEGSDVSRWRFGGFRARRWGRSNLLPNKRYIGWQAKKSFLFSSSERKNSVPRWNGKQAKPKKKRRLFFIIFVIFILLTVQLFIYVDKHVKVPLMHLAKIRCRQIATQAVNRAIMNKMIHIPELNKLIEWKLDSHGKVKSFMLNYNEHMRITSEAVSIVQSSLKDIYQMNDKIPLGQALGSPLLASFGPHIPVKMEPQGVVKVELKTRPLNVGINMVLVEVYMKIIEEVSIVIPFDLESEIVETTIPVSYLLVVGDVPMYYYDGKGQPVGTNRDKAPPLSLSLTDHSAKNRESKEK